MDPHEFCIDEKHEEAMLHVGHTVFFHSVRPFVSELFRETEEEEAKLAPKWVEQRKIVTQFHEERQMKKISIELDGMYGGK